MEPLIHILFQRLRSLCFDLFLFMDYETSFNATCSGVCLKIEVVVGVNSI